MNQTDYDKLSADIKEHFMRCETCSNYFDMRYLGEVLFHNNGECIKGGKAPDIPYSSSRKKGDSAEWTKDKKPINLN